MKWLSYHPNRRKQWTEHDCFPRGSIKYMQESPRRYNLDSLLIYEMSDDRMQLRFIPREEWPDAPTKE